MAAASILSSSSSSSAAASSSVHSVMDDDGHNNQKIQPILIPARVQQESGLWYTRQEGIVKAGDGRHGSPYIIGEASIMQLRDVYKVSFK